MARGYPGQFGRSVNAPWVWIGLCILFALPFARPPLRLLHLDLAVLLAFSVSYAFFGAAELGVSVPSAYPLLGYLLVRMVIVARRPPAPPPRLLTGPGFLLLAGAFLLAFRIALNVADGNVIDVGYASVIGADRLAAGDPLYGAFPPDNEHGDTYGPAAYAAYVPFELLLPWTSGTSASLAPELATISVNGNASQRYASSRPSAPSRSRRPSSQSRPAQPRSNATAAAWAAGSASHVPLVHGSSSSNGM